MPFHRHDGELMTSDIDRTPDSESQDELRQAIETFELPEAVRAEIAKYEPSSPSFELLMTLLP